MNNKQVRNFYIDKANIPCPLTEQLISAGYVQKSGGYIDYAKKCGIDAPTQYWHLIESWSNRQSEDVNFTKQIQCGELIFWMAEVSKAVPYDELVKLKDLILNEYLHQRGEGNRKIQEICFDSIVELVEANNINE